MIDAFPGDIFGPGQILNNTYEIEGLLGRGGTGEVYRARNLVSGRIVAIKALNARFSGNDGYVELMKREEQMRDIVDDAVVRYTECSRTDQGHVFLVMDFIDGPSMADVMADRRMESRELMIVAHRVAEGLGAAHKKGIVHRDLSPDNIILRGGSPERATIIDFGIAKDTAAGAHTVVGNDFAGKYEYAAPEQLEGKAEPRSDLYALGALLLAAFRGQVPFAGATPGEMIRRKQNPLDLTGVPEPLKGLIGWLSAPNLAERAPSASAVMAQLSQNLNSANTRGRPLIQTRGVPEKERSRAGFIWLALLVLLALAGGGGYFGGYFDRFLVQPLLKADPYLLTAIAPSESSAGSLTGNAPDAASALALAQAYTALTGEIVDSAALQLADGMPVPNWAAAASEVFAAATGLEDGEIALSGNTAIISGMAPNAVSRQTIIAALQSWSSKHGFTLVPNLITGPRLLPYETVATALAEVSDCGPLTQSGLPGEPYPIGATIHVSGPISSAGLAKAIEAHLSEQIGDRTVQVGLMALNTDLCDVRKVLPIVPDSNISIWFGQGATEEANLTGVFHKGDNPVVEVLAPADLTEGQLWVVVVDNTGKVFNVVPNVYSAETRLTALGQVKNGMRRMRVLFSPQDGQNGKQLLAVTVNDSDFGMSEVIAFVTKTDLFGTRRPRDESISSFVKALREAEQERPGNIVGVATRILDARP